VAPAPGGGIDRAQTSFVSPYGEVSCKWWVEAEDGHGPEVRWRGSDFYIQVQIPPNTRAVIMLPGEVEIINIGSGFHECFIKDFRVPILGK
jgi:alpha-L-rhamnosidase